MSSSYTKMEATLQACPNNTWRSK